MRRAMLCYHRKNTAYAFLTVSKQIGQFPGHGDGIKRMWATKLVLNTLYGIV